MSVPETAVILAAGEGTRLRPFTLQEPKCFAKVGGRQIIDVALASLARHNCRTVRIVTGHLARRLQDVLGTGRHGMTLEYVHNAAYRENNSMYSLMMGLEGVAEPVWVLEGDVVFDDEILSLPQAGFTSWVVDSSGRILDGCFLTAGEDGTLDSQRIVRHPSFPTPRELKSVGILKIEPQDLDRIRTWLKSGVEAGRQNDYYDLILGSHLKEIVIKAADVAGRRWFEIDTPEDLESARTLFS
jgi:L-glutamine-phosphate cytidylyltransferase